MDTKTTVMSLFEEATEEVFITSYVFHEAAEFFALLAEKSDANPNFRVTFVVDLTHRREAPNQPLSLIAQSFANDFQKKHWRGERPPEIWHDPRLFESAHAEGGIFHAKTVIIDRKVAFITSANFTGAAQSRNIEAGVLRQPRTAARLHDYFSGLIRTGVLRRVA
jgi:phosphatidylserine/phosphatidylglycerophosphate/cardiolipin synthase-like enzyme